jgi:hypothetical protein
MAVYAPDDTSLNPSSSSGAADPNLLQRLLNYINPIPPAAADTLNQAPNPLNNPTPVPAALQGGGSPVPPAVLGGGQPPAPMPPGAPTPPIPGQPIPGGSSGGGGASPPVGPSILPQARGVMPVMGPPQGPTPWFTPSNTPYAPNPAVGAPVPPTRPTGPGFRGSGTGAAGSPSMRRGPASVASGAGSPFTFQRPNMDVAGGALARGGPAQMGMLDLSSLFGRR